MPAYESLRDCAPVRSPLSALRSALRAGCFPLCSTDTHTKVQKFFSLSPVAPSCRPRVPTSPSAGTSTPGPQTTALPRFSPWSKPRRAALQGKHRKGNPAKCEVNTDQKLLIFDSCCKHPLYRLMASRTLQACGTLEACTLHRLQASPWLTKLPSVVRVAAPLSAS